MNNRIIGYCDNPACVCEDKCCQECQERCENPCENVADYDKVYASTQHLLEVLDLYIDKVSDAWIVAVARDKIQEQDNEIKNLSDQLSAAQAAITENERSKLPNKMNIKEIRELGLLAELNRAFLHPLGLALEIIIEDDGTEKFGGINLSYQLSAAQYAITEMEKICRIFTNDTLWQTYTFTD